MSLDVAAARARFSALDRDLVFFDAPGGSQVPDEVIEAVANYFRTSNANVSGPYETSRHTEALEERARETAARFLGCTPEETVFGPNMTTLSFALSRTAGRAFEPGDEIVCTRLDHDANVSPWLELASDRDLTVRFVDINDDTTLDLEDLERQLGERTRIVAFPVASNAVGTLTDVPRIAALAHEAGAIAWADAVHYAPHGPIDVEAMGVDVLICSPYKYFGPHLGVASVRRKLIERWRPYKVRPAPVEPPGKRFETGRSRTSSSPASSPQSSTSSRSAGTRSSPGSTRSVRGSSPACHPRSGCTGSAGWTAACPPSRSPSTDCRHPRPLRASASGASPCGTATTTRSR